MLVINLIFIMRLIESTISICASRSIYRETCLHMHPILKIGHGGDGYWFNLARHAHNLVRFEFWSNSTFTVSSALILLWNSEQNSAGDENAVTNTRVQACVLVSIFGYDSTCRARYMFAMSDWEQRRNSWFQEKPKTVSSFVCARFQSFSPACVCDVSTVDT